MLSLPKVSVEHSGVDGGYVLPVAPRCPVLAEVPRIPKHVCTESAVRKCVLAITESEGGGIVVVLGENHHIGGGTLPDHDRVNSLYKRS